MASVLFLVPNIVGHFRLLLIIVAIGASTLDHHVPALWIFGMSFVLDGLDGWFARRLNQATQFGATYDVFIDIFARGFLWVNSLPQCSRSLALVVILLECFTFVCTNADAVEELALSKGKEGHWKDAKAGPQWVKAVMANGFRSALGSVVVAGLHGCPLWVYSVRWTPHILPHRTLLMHLGCIVVPGRILAAAVELTLIYNYLSKVARRDMQARQRNHS